MVNTYSYDRRRVASEHINQMVRNLATKQLGQQGKFWKEDSRKDDTLGLMFSDDQGNWPGRGDGRFTDLPTLLRKSKDMPSELPGFLRALHKMLEKFASEHPDFEDALKGTRKISIRWKGKEDEEWSVQLTDEYGKGRAVTANVTQEVEKNLDHQFSGLIRSQDADGLMREEAKIVREFQTGIKDLRDRLGLIQKATGYSHPLPDAAVSLVWNTGEKGASLAVNHAIKGYQDALQTATIAAIKAEQWFADKITEIDPERTLFRWPSF